MCGWHPDGDRVTLKPPGTLVGISSLHLDPRPFPQCRDQGCPGSLP